MKTDTGVIVSTSEFMRDALNWYIELVPVGFSIGYDDPKPLSTNTYRDHEKEEIT